MCYTIVPYLLLLLLRVYVLAKAQAFRRSLRRNLEFRRYFLGESTPLQATGGGSDRIKGSAVAGLPVEQQWRPSDQRLWTQ